MEGELSSTSRGLSCSRAVASSWCGVGSPQRRATGARRHGRTTPSTAVLNASVMASQGTNTDGGVTTNLVNGEWTAGSTSTFIDVNDPSTQRVLTRVPETSLEDMVKIVDGAQAAWENEWRDSSVLRRQAVMLK